MKLISMVFGSLIAGSSASVAKVRAPQTHQIRLEDHINRATSMLVTDVGDEMC